MTSSVPASTAPFLSNELEPMELSQDNQPPLPVGGSVETVAHTILSDTPISTSGGQNPLLNVSKANDSVYQPLLSLLPAESQQLAQEKLETLLASFGVAYPCTEENKKQTIERIGTILDSLKESTVLTATEKAVLPHSAEKIMQNSQLFHLILKIADRHNLVIMISNNIKSLDLTEKPFSQKIEAVLKYLRDNQETITKLRCESLGITNIPEEICTLENLKSLYLSYNQLRSLPAEIGSLQNLQHLWLTRNQLSSVPDSIGSLQNLQDLWLTRNQLSSVPDSVGSLQNLQDLCLENNQLSSVPDSVGSLQNLRWLYLSRNKLSSLPAEINTLQNLLWVDLSKNQLRAIPETFFHLSDLKYIILAKDDTVEIPDPFKSRVTVI